MAVRRVAIIFDNKVRPDTTGVYCRRALGILAEVEHFLPSELSRIPRRGFDLYLNIDDGLEYYLPRDLRPCAWWAIDTHLNYDWCLKRAGDFDFVFAAQRDGAERMRADGIAPAAWLPLACDPEIHRKHDVPKTFNVSFVGHVFPGPRAELVALLQERFREVFVGQCFFDEMARTYSASRTVFNRSIRNDINMRVFEALACGSLLVTNDLRENGQEELFRDGVHLATYGDAEELLEKVAYYLAHEEARERVAAAGCAEVLAKDTYRHRLERLLYEVESQLPTVVSVPASSGADAPAAPAAQTAVSGPRARSTEALVPPNDSSGTGPTADGQSELLTLLPETAQRILLVGDGLDPLANTLRARRPADVITVEANPEAAPFAQSGLDEPLTGNAEEKASPFEAGSFDAILCADALARVRDPAAWLLQVRGWLRPEGRLALTVPNVRHHSVVRQLLDGNWTYGPPGILDPRHRRFFTRRDVEKALFRAGFAIDTLRAVPSPDDNGRQADARAGRVRVGRLHVGGMRPEEAEEFYVARYLVRAAPAQVPDYGLTSIIIVTHNQLAYTRQCVESIYRCTDEPFELVFVDNGSTDGTPEYLRSLAEAKVVANGENRGFPAAVNQGIREAAGNQVLLLNNDCLATTGWLARLLRALHRDPRIGLVGPCSNCVSGEQQVAVTYDDVDELDGFSWDWGKAHDGCTEDTDRLVGFCLLIRREVVDKVGLLDEQFGVGCFEDDDYCLRAIREGYRAVIARDAFVHHFGGRTFVGSGVDFAALMSQNERLFRAKWREPPRPDPPSAAPRAGAEPAAGPLSLGVAPAGGLRLKREKVRLSLCMIVRDSARTIRACLESVRPWVDEIVVVDTGSKDDTPRIVQELGARLFHFPWCDSFSAARNESLRHARGEWIFWMDSDDTIDPENGRKLRELLRRPADPSVLGYVIQVHCPGPEKDGVADVTVVDHVKLFRNRPDLRFERRIHEQIIPAIRRAGGDIAWTDLFVVHSGADHSPEGEKRKLERDLRLLHLELKEQPDHPFTLFNLGMTYADAGRHRKAVRFLRRSIAKSGPQESQLRKAYALLVSCYLEMGQQKRAWKLCRQGLKLFPQDEELRFRKGILLHGLGRLREAVQTYLELLENPGERHFTSVVQGITGFRARHNLAVVYSDLAELSHAEDQWRLVVQEVPGYREGWKALGEVLVRQKKYKEALEVALQLTGDPALSAEGSILRSRVVASQGDIRAARKELERAVAECPDDLEPLRALCQLLFEHADPLDAERALTELSRRDSADAAARHNLGTVYLSQNRYAEAVDVYGDSLRLRPDSPATYLNLGYALREYGRLKEAIAAWEQVIRLAPGDPAATEALREVQKKGGERK